MFISYNVYTIHGKQRQFLTKWYCVQFLHAGGGGEEQRPGGHRPRRGLQGAGWAGAGTQLFDYIQGQSKSFRIPQFFGLSLEDMLQTGLAMSGRLSLHSSHGGLKWSGSFF